MIAFLLTHGEINKILLRHVDKIKNSFEEDSSFLQFGQLMLIFKYLKIIHGEKSKRASLKYLVVIGLSVWTVE